MSSKLPGIIRDNWHRFFWTGVLMCLCGGLAMMMPTLTTIAIKYLIGATFFVVGVSHLLQAFNLKTWSGVLFDVLSAVAFILGGVFLLADPLTGLLGITVLIALTLIFDGVFKIVSGLRLRPNDGWLWIALAGVVSIILGVMIWNRLPSSAVTTVGFLTGIALLLSGLSYVVVGLRAKEDR
jgi:uncharacterized membrane protein HdeD (DUF308 family)